MSEQNTSEIISKANDLVPAEVIRKEELGGISTTALWNLRNQPDFPQPFKLTKRIVLYSRSAVRRFVESKQA